MRYLADADAVLREQLVTQRFFVAGRRPRHIGDLVRRPQMRRRIAVAIEAEFHRQRLGAISERHRIDASVAFDAANPLGDVDVVPEEDILRQDRDTIPVQRLVIGEARPHRPQHRRASPDLRMARHAGVRRRQTGARPFRDRCVAIAAIDAKLPSMMAMTERDRLTGRMNVSAGDPI